MANNWAAWDAAHRGMHTSMTDGATKLRQQVAHTAYQNTVKNGGVTINLKGNMPSKGFAFSPFKGVETQVPSSSFSEKDIDSFVDKHFDKLSQAGNHIGIWENTEDGNTYMDISQVGSPNAATLQKAQDAKQLAAFDLEKFEEIPLGTMKGGVYTKSYEAANHPYLNRR